MENSTYDYYKKLHPEWSEEQIWIAVSLNLEGEKTVDSNKDVDIHDPDVIKGILEGARNWLKEVLPSIFVKVARFFEDLISNLGQWVQKGLEYVLNAIEYLYDKGKLVAEALKTPVN